MEHMDPQVLLKQWHSGVRIRHEAHHRMATQYDRYDRLLSVPMAVLSAVVGTSLFVGLEKGGGTVAAGLISMVVAVLASVQTALKCAEKASSHRASALRYGALRRRLETFLASKNPPDTDS